MIRIKWIITDDITNVSLEEFNIEWNGIYGYFEIQINHQKLGFYPNKRLAVDQEGNEDILYWFSKFAEGLIALNKCSEYKYPLMSMNLANIIMIKQEDDLQLVLVNCNKEQIKWSERVNINEFCEIVLENIISFVEVITKKNPMLLKANMLMDLLDLKELLCQEYK